MTLAVLTVTKQGIALGDRILAAEPQSVLYVPAKYGLEPSDRIRVFPGQLAPLLAEIYGSYDGFVFLMATGIVVRMIAEHIKDKRYDPAVVVMDITGRFAISLVSGHLGGANALTRRLAEITGATPVITTGTDVNETIAPDVIAMEIGGEVDDFEVMKKVSAALVDGNATGVVDLSGVDPPSLRGPLKGNVKIFPTVDVLRDSKVAAGIVITNRLLDLSGLRRPVVVLRPKNLVVGVGCNRGTTADEIVEAIERVLREHGFALKSVRTLATVDAKRDETGLVEAARRLGLPLAFCDKATLNAVPDVPNRSEAPMKFVGVQGVAEPSALAVSSGRLVVEKVKSGNVTVAVAECPAGRKE
ncbi:MAG: cobalt-precorrin 5A hydrolase [candidate division NC10 bacterium]|nr:cobalt-precorrin 5A hydrolase [Candidatus Rokubacteria bacterium]MBI2563062.1 cobalt-precorrin 5A hydrolase [candidate division NC10 bacterium]